MRCSYVEVRKRLVMGRTCVIASVAWRDATICHAPGFNASALTATTAQPRSSTEIKPSRASVAVLYR